jgi:hypothetical protein
VAGEAGVLVAAANVITGVGDGGWLTIRDGAEALVGGWSE